jgi:hypothetical protein
MTRTRQQKRDADAGIAPPAPAPAPKRKRRTKKAPPPIEPAAKAKLVRVLASEPFFLREISSALVYRDVTSLSLVDKGADALLSKPENSDAWKPFVTALDTWKCFGKIEEAQKSLMEQHYGFRKICATLATGTCAECGGGGAYINALSCERTCLGCWSCRDCGEHGTEGAQRSQMCSPGYAKTHFLITDTDIKKCAMLHIDDATKAHGLMNAKMRAILVRDAQKLAIARHGSLDAVEAVKAIRHAKSMESYRAKIEALEAPHADKIASWKDRKAKAEDKYAAALAAWTALTATKDPSNVLKAGARPWRSFHEYRPRAEGKYPKKPSDLGSSWNFLARNQRARTMHVVGEKYGLHKCHPKELTRRRKDAPVFVITESTDEAAIKEQFSSHGTVKGFGENIFEVTHSTSPGSTIVVAMKCDLRKQATSCAPEKRSTVASEYGASVGGTDQNHSLMLDDELTIIGMPGSCLYSDTACIWAQGEFIQLENMRLRTQPADSPDNRSPCLVLSGSGRTVLKDCIVELGPGGGMTVLTHSKCHIRDSTVINFGHAPGSATLHFEDDATLAPPDVVLTGNTFAWHGPESIFPFGIYTAPHGPVTTTDFRRQLQDSQNTSTRARSRETPYVFLAVNRNDPTAPPVAVKAKQSARDRALAMGSVQLLTGTADPNTPVSELLAKLAKKSDIETSPLDNDVAAPWLYVASRPDAPRPHPLTTIGELEAPEPYVDTSQYGHIYESRKVLYLIDERTAADSEPMVIE